MYNSNHRNSKVQTLASQSLIILENLIYHLFLMDTSPQSFHGPEILHKNIK